jgi:hypothetical protein
LRYAGSAPKGLKRHLLLPVVALRGLLVDTINFELDLVGDLTAEVLKILRAGSEIDLQAIRWGGGMVVWW